MPVSWQAPVLISTELRGIPDAEVIATLTRVPGIGVWTAEIYAMFSLGRADVFAPGDLALQEAARVLYDLAETDDGERTQADGRGVVAVEIGCRADTLGLLPGGEGQGRDQMTRVLQSERREPVSGTVRSIVVFLHGYGANGADLLGLADPLGEHMPDTLFVAPDAPETIPGMPFGLQWFPIPWIDGIVRGRGGTWLGRSGGRSERVSRCADGR